MYDKEDYFPRMVTRLKLIMNVLCRLSLGRVIFVYTSPVHDLLKFYLLDFHSGFISKYFNCFTIPLLAFSVTVTKWYFIVVSQIQLRDRSVSMYAKF